MNLPPANNLPRHAFLAQKRGFPLVVMTSLPGCPYCDLVRQHLVPMMAEGRVLAVQLNLGDTSTQIVDFDGAPRSPDAIGTRWGARFAPTVLFFDVNGKELAERLKGVAVPDFYGAYLDERLETSARVLIKRASQRR